MRPKFIPACCVCVLISGCQLSPNGFSIDRDQENPKFCLVSQKRNTKYNCNLAYWMAFWTQQDGLPWAERREQIKSLLDDTSVTSQLKKILMSQAKDTPYQDRLRAQGWTEKLMPQLSESMQQLLHVIVYQPSQAVLEYESALTILTRLNSQQSEQLQEQKMQLEQQQSQIEAFLKIEASIVDAEENNP